MDHEAQIRILGLAAEQSGARLRITNCLGACNHSNVVVLRMSDQGKASTTWLNGILSIEQTTALGEAIAAWPQDQARLHDLSIRASFQPDAEAADCLVNADRLHQSLTPP